LDEECPGLRRHVRVLGETLLQATGQVLNRANLGRVAIEAERMTVAFSNGLSELLTGTSLVTSTGLVESLREIKDREEIAEIRASIKLAERSFRIIQTALRADQTEREIAANLEHQIRMLGGTGCAFATIVGVGSRSALPHGNPGERRIGDGDFVLLDWGARSGLYMSDLTRILVTSKLSPKLQRVYGVVLEAQMAAIDKIRPGALAGDVDAAARQVISAAGFGKVFGHGSGHGFGLEIHETPRLAPDQKEPLKAGMVVTVEPGIYLPGWGGIRIEDDVLVTKTGHEILTSLPKDLESCLVP
jgi:Xaa-Pro aminopeptidase